MKYLKWFEQVRKTDIASAGGKGANLGELTHAKIQIPPGFVVLSSAYEAFIKHNDLDSKIQHILSVCDVNNAKSLKDSALKIKKLITDGELPEDISHEIIQAYQQLGEQNGAPASGLAVAIRSSATAEDSPEASFAGQQESFLNVIGDANVLLKVRSCWESLFGERSIFYRSQQKISHQTVSMAVPIQMMVQSEVSGVMFTTDPISKDKDKIVIEAIWGLGDYLVQGVVTPDHFEISKSSGQITAKHVGTQEIREVRGSQGVKQEKVEKKYQSIQKISDEIVLELADLGKKIQQHYFFPQDIEWAYASNKIYITQSRPITTLDVVESSDSKHSTQNLKLILEGTPVSAGIVTGTVRQITDAKNLHKIKIGDILVTKMTTPDFVPAMKKAAGIITDQGGVTSHASIVSRELGVPCIVGAKTATKVLTDGGVITMNGSTGQVFSGTYAKGQISVLSPKTDIEDEKLITATKVYVNVADVDLAELVSQKHVDGIGLLRAEFIMADIGVHPKKMIADGNEKEYINTLAEKIGQTCKAFFPRPVIYRSSDFKTNEYRSLKGGDLYEPQEPNPMLGFRGAYRYIKTPEIFNLELEAIKKVRNKMGLSNVWLMIPYVSTVKELADVKRLIATSGLYRTSSFKLFMMVEIPANVILLEEFIKKGIDGVSIGSNDLTMLTLGIDRDNSDVAPIFDELDPAAMWMFEKTVKTAIKHNIICSICGQAPSQYPELVEKLVEWGITSISVNADAISRTRQTIHHAEKKLITNKSR